MIQNRVSVVIYHSLIELGCGQLLRISKIVVELHQSYRACVVLSNSLDKKHLFHYRRTGSRGEGSGSQIEKGEGWRGETGGEGFKGPLQLRVPLACPPSPQCRSPVDPAHTAWARGVTGGSLCTHKYYLQVSDLDLCQAVSSSGK